MPPRTETDADDPPHLRTAWHPLLVMLLELLLPREHWKVLAEHALTREPRRIDVVIVRQLDASAWRPRHLRSVLDDLRAHNLVHFKGATDELEVVDALQLLSYAYQYMALNGLHHADALSLRVVAPTLTPRFRAQLRALGGALSETAVKGVHTGHVQGIALRVVETDVAWPAPGEHLLFPISPACLRSPTSAPAFDDNERALYYRLLQGISQLAQDPTWRVIMKDATLVNDTTREALMDLLAVLPPELRLAGIGAEELAVLPPELRLAGIGAEELAVLPLEQRLAGLAPEQRLAGLAPEQRLAGLSEADRVLALPDAALRALPADYLATLPADAQARIRARLGR
jgi:hypothetical protein